MHRLSAIVMGLETECLCTAGIFRNWRQIKFLVSNSRQHICVTFIFCHCSTWSPLFTKPDVYFFMLMILASRQHVRQLTVRKPGRLSTDLPFLLRLAHCVPFILLIFYWQMLSSPKKLVEFVTCMGEWGIILNPQLIFRNYYTKHLWNFVCLDFVACLLESWTEWQIQVPSQCC